MKNVIKKIFAYFIIIGELFQTTGVYALTKEENIYAKLKENGEIESVSVSEHLFDYQNQTINDKTVLENIKNENDKNILKQNGNDLIWTTNGNNIYYQGTYKKNLPISLSVKYYLNEEEKKLNDILGKKGKIKIVLNYKNNLDKNVNVGGNTEKMYVPYAVVTTSILNNETNKNIKVSNGKIIDNGINSVIMAITTPGLSESLKSSKVKEKNNVEISFETDNFELSSIYSVATTDLFDESSLDILSGLNDVYNNVDLLQSNMNTIVDTSKKLSDGSNKMDSEISELNNKMQELIGKYKKYRNKDKEELKEELLKILEENINFITPALEEEITEEASKVIKENKEELEDAVIDYTKKNTQKVVEEEVNKIISQLNIRDLLEKVINSNVSDLIKNDAEIKVLTNALQESISNELKEVVSKEFEIINNSISSDLSQNEEYVNNIAEKYGITYEQASGIVNEVQSDTLAEVRKNVSEANIPQRIINSLADRNNVSMFINNYVTNLNNKLSVILNRDTTINEYSEELKTKIMNALSKDLQNDNIYMNLNVRKYISNIVDRIINETANDLSNKYTEDYTNKVVKRVVEKEFSEESVDTHLREILDLYEDDINKQVTTIDETVNNLSNVFTKLSLGSNKISSGVTSLSEGLEKYNTNGINKINKLVNEDVKNVHNRVNSLVRLSNENKTIDTIPEGASSSSRIIFMIDSASKTETKKETSEKKNKEKNTIWDKIKGLFK